jgi:hypothetical protein
MLRVLHESLELIQPILVPLCFILAWVFIITLFSTLWGSFQAVTQRAKEMHQIPCANCRFSTNDYRLKCTVNPSLAHTEKAVDCADFSQKMV